MKKVTFNSRPAAAKDKNTVDAWVDDRQPATQPFKRLTIDIPLSLHQRVKSQCALQGLKMADVLREFLEQHFAEAGQGPREGDTPRNSVNTIL